MNLFSIPILQDNYVWILINDSNRCLIIDPGEAMPIIAAIEKNKWKPEAIFLTHCHNDHTDGVIILQSYFPNLLVFGPETAQKKGVTKVVRDGESVLSVGREFTVFFTPGHTLEDLCFFSFPYLFCGDTLFSGGCGKLFEGTSEQMYKSLQKINQLPKDTLICCAHEYTFSNMKFAINMLPNDFSIKNYYIKVSKLHEKKLNTLPTTLENERKINLFLRINDPDFIKKIPEEIKLYNPEERLAWLRSKKDCF